MEKRSNLGDRIRKKARMGGKAWIPMKVLVSLMDEGLPETARKAWTVIGRRPAIRKYVRSLNLPEEELEKQRKTEFPRDIRFSVLVPLYNTSRDMLEEMIDSVRAQTWENWELCLADGSDGSHAYVGEVCRKYAGEDKRIKYRKLEKNGGISENTNACIAMASGDYIALFDHDDLLLPYALYENMKAICETGADFLYSDEMVFASPRRDRVIGLHFKPDFSPDALLTNNYICHLSVFSAELLRKAGGFRSAYDGSQDHDLILRLTDAARQVKHIPKVLYLWRSHGASVAGDIESKTYAVQAGRNAVRDFLRGKGIDAEATSSPVYPTMYRVKLPVPENARVSVILSGLSGPEEARQRIQDKKNKTSFPPLEWIVPIKGYEIPSSDTMDTVRLIPAGNSPAQTRNLGAAAAVGDFLLFLDAELEPLETGWIQEMLMYSHRENTGAVGGRLLFSNGTVRHVGIILGLGRRRTASRSHFRAVDTNGGYYGVTAVVGNVSAVTAECMMVRRELFEKLGGFDEALGQALYDADFCLRLREMGLLNVYTPYAELRGGECSDYLSELGRENDQYPAMRERFLERWQAVIDRGDPYYNPNFSLDTLDFRPRTL